MNIFNNIKPQIILSVLPGIIIVCAGIYYKINDYKSSGVSMGDVGQPYTEGIIDGNGMIICGVIILILFYLIFNRKMI